MTKLILKSGSDAEMRLLSIDEIAQISGAAEAKAEAVAGKEGSGKLAKLVGIPQSRAERAAEMAHSAQ